MDFKEIKELIKIFDESGLSTLSITKQNAKIKLEKKALGQAILNLLLLPLILPCKKHRKTFL